MPCSHWVNVVGSAIMFPAACAGIATNATVTIIAALITPAMAFFVFALMEPKSRFPHSRNCRMSIAMPFFSHLPEKKSTNMSPSPQRSGSQEFARSKQSLRHQRFPDLYINIHAISETYTNHRHLISVSTFSHRPTKSPHLLRISTPHSQMTKPIPPTFVICRVPSGNRRKIVNLWSIPIHAHNKTTISHHPA